MFLGIFANAQLCADDGFMYVRTLRGEAKFFADSAFFDKGDTIKAHEICVKTGANSFASAAFQTNIALMVAENSALKIESYEVLEPIKDSKISECAASILKIELSEGEIFISRAEARAKSKIEVLTPFGTFEVLGSNMRIVIAKDSASASAFEAAINYFKPKSDDAQYIGIGYSASIDKNTFEIKRKKISKELNEKDEELFARANDAWKNSYFEYSQAKTPTAQRVLSKNFWVRPELVLKKK